MGVGPFAEAQVFSIGVPFAYSNPQRFLGTWDLSLYLTNIGSAPGVYAVQFLIGDPCCAPIDSRFSPLLTVQPGETRLFSFHWLSGPWDITQVSGPDEGIINLFTGSQPAEIEAGTALTGIMTGWPQEWDQPF